MALRRLTPVVSQPHTRITGPGELMIPVRLRGDPVPVESAPVWDAAGIPNQVDPVDVAIATFNVFDFAESVGVPPAQVFVGVLPTGLAVDIDTGDIDGTPTVVGNVVGITATMDNGVGTDATVFEWDITA